jgi:RimJ/RimL family protein N-acetyltransferase
MELHTPRLRLRRWHDSDQAPYSQLCADPDVMRHIGDGSTLDPAAAAAQIERFEAHWEEYGYGLWAVDHRTTKSFLGFAGLSQPFFLPEVLPAVEVGWRFARSAWGHGYAQESGAAALELGFGRLGLDRVVGIAADGNRASRNALEKLGLTVERRTAHPDLGVPLVVYERRRHAPVD